MPPLEGFENMFSFSMFSLDCHGPHHSLSVKWGRQINGHFEGIHILETSYTVGGNVSWWSHCGKQNGGFLKI